MTGNYAFAESTWRCGISAARIAASRSIACSAARCAARWIISCYLAQGTPESLRKQCDAAVRRGYRCFYLKVVGIDGTAEERMLEAIRGAVGVEGKIRIDANEAWTVPEAVHWLTRWHAAFGIDFAEARSRRSRSP